MNPTPIFALRDERGDLDWFGFDWGCLYLRALSRRMGDLERNHFLNRKSVFWKFGMGELPLSLVFFLVHNFFSLSSFSEH